MRKCLHPMLGIVSSFWARAQLRRAQQQAPQQMGVPLMQHIAVGVAIAAVYRSLCGSSSHAPDHVGIDHAMFCMSSESNYSVVEYGACLRTMKSW
jgi:hypothetical protein